MGELLVWKIKVLFRLGEPRSSQACCGQGADAVASTKTSPGLSRWFCIPGVHRVWFTAVLFPLREVPDSTPALSLVLVRCPFLHHPLLPGRGARCFPACRTGWRSCAAPCPGGCSPALFSVQTHCRFVTHVELNCLGTTRLCDPLSNLLLQVKPTWILHVQWDGAMHQILSAPNLWVTQSQLQVCSQALAELSLCSPTLAAL